MKASCLILRYGLMRVEEAIVAAGHGKRKVMRAERFSPLSAVYDMAMRDKMA